MDVLPGFPLQKMQRKEHEHVTGSAETQCGLHPVRVGGVGWHVCETWSQKLQPGFCSVILEALGRNWISFLALSIVISKTHMKMLEGRFEG